MWSVVLLVMQLDNVVALGLVKVQASTDDVVVDHAVDGPNSAITLVTSQTTALGLVVNLRELEVTTGDQFVWIIFGAPATFSSAWLLQA